VFCGIRTNSEDRDTDREADKLRDDDDFAKKRKKIFENASRGHQ
jgi:hypothetical protein